MIAMNPYGDLMLNHVSNLEEEYINQKGWKSFFFNSNPNNCPIEKCVLKEKSCKSIHPEIGKNFNVEMRDYDPWSIVARNFHKDWVVEVCVECSHQWQTITFPDWHISQCVNYVDKFVVLIVDA